MEEVEGTPRYCKRRGGEGGPGSRELAEGGGLVSSTRSTNIDLDRGRDL